MKINHINLTVNDVTASRDFLETYFGLTWQEVGERGSLQ